VTSRFLATFVTWDEGKGLKQRSMQRAMVSLVVLISQLTLMVSGTPMATSSQEITPSRGQCQQIRSVTISGSLIQTAICVLSGTK